VFLCVLCGLIFTTEDTEDTEKSKFTHGLRPFGRLRAGFCGWNTTPARQPPGWRPYSDPAGNTVCFGAGMGVAPF
jgi:hypothetical protein